VDAQAPFDKGQLVAQRRAPKVPAGDLLDPDPFDRVRGLGACRCFGSDRTPVVAPHGVFRSRTVSTIVAKWFVLIARGTVDKIYRFEPLRNA
jgi:hypothetical protein